SAENRRVIPGGDPDNPLGRRWLGLKGISGDALDQEGFGIHGTIDPSSIGQAKSLGCVRMHNDEVALVYDLLMPGKSKVTILP
ncbi:MAG: L,D-transpeptidase, partial [Phycisphaerae bacterium]